MKVDRIYNKSSQRMNELPDESIDMSLTSPPYWGLRDYGEDVKEVWGGDSGCEHDFNSLLPGHHPGQVPQTKKQVASGSKDSGQFCQLCGTWYGQLGLEPTFQLYLDHMMIVCAEIKRVLKKTGSFWLNMGDTYAGGGGGNYGTGLSVVQKDKGLAHLTNVRNRENWLRENRLQPKCLIGIPWRLVLRLIDEQGWVLRNAGIWNKPNSMPSSTKDRLSNSYEFLFHFVKNTKPQYCWNEKTGLMADRKPKELKEGINWEWRKCPKCEGTGKVEEKVCPRCKGTGKIKHSFWHSLGYWYDLDAIREPYTEPLNRWGGNKIEIPKKTKWRSPEEKAKWQASVRQKTSRPYSAGKNPGDVWTIPTQPRPEAHFATFPDKLCIKPILATCPLEICKKCGKARVRITEKPDMSQRPKRSEAAKTFEDKHLGFKERSAGQKYQEWRNKNPDITIGWTDCGCNAGWESGILLDPFAGRGTALIMAKKLGKHFIGYELKKEYCEKLIRPALEEIDPLFNWKTPSPAAG